MKTCPFCFEQVPADEITCPLCDEKLDPPPFTKLTTPRAVPQGLPPDLAAFYQRYEGCGMDDEAEGEPRDLRLAKLDELKVLRPKDLGAESVAEWGTFKAIRIGAGAYGDSVCYVLRAPVAPAGAIMAFGMDVAGPGGAGPAALQGSLVLAANFNSWLARLREDGWQEYGLQPGTIPELPEERARSLKRLFRSLNPAIAWRVL